MPFFSGDSDNVIGGPVQLYITDRTGNAAPTRLSEIFNTSTYAANATYGWAKIGLTNSPTAVRLSSENEEWRSEQFGRFLTVPVDFEGEVEFEAMEWKQAEKLRVNSLAITGSEPVTGEKRTDYTTKSSYTQKRIAIVQSDRFGLLHARIIPNAQYGGDSIENTFGRGQPNLQPMVYKAYPDTDIINSTDSNAVIMYDLDQEV